MSKSIKRKPRPKADTGKRKASKPDLVKRIVANRRERKAIVRDIDAAIVETGSEDRYYLIPEHLFTSLKRIVLADVVAKLGGCDLAAEADDWRPTFDIEDAEVLRDAVSFTLPALEAAGVLKQPPATEDSK